MEIKLFGTKIYISYILTALICIMFFSDRTGLAVPTATAVIVHEMSHLAAMRRFGCAPHNVDIVPGCINIVCPEIVERRKDNIILLAGPTSNIIAALLFFGIYMIVTSDRLFVFGVVQVVVAAFNLLPARGLDGGSLLHNLLLLFCSTRTAIIISTVVSVITAVAFIFLGVIMLIKCGSNPSLLILGLYIAVFTVVKI